MALLEDMFKGGGVSGVLIGIGVALAAPVLLPAAATGVRPLAKALIRGTLAMATTVKEVAAEAGEQLSDLVAEVQAEHTTAGETTEPVTRSQEDQQSRIIVPS